MKILTPHVIRSYSDQVHEALHDICMAWSLHDFLDLKVHLSIGFLQVLWIHLEREELKLED